jgi:hypothetical protein
MLPQTESGPGTFAASADRDSGAPECGARYTSTAGEEVTQLAD